MKKNCFLLLFLITSACQTLNKNADNQAITDKNFNWALLPFVKADAANPILLPVTHTTFYCPIHQKNVFWEANDVYNPASVVKDGKIFMIYRAEDTLKAVNGTSRLGLASSNDGIHFERLPEPVFYPDNDAMKIFEWMGGCEDPRVIEDSTGRYFMTYTAYDGKTARLCVASSPDLKKWEKHGLAFKSTKQVEMWSKSGAVVCKMNTSGQMVAVRIKGKYWMYWGENGLLASSDNLTDWEFLADKQGEPKSVLPKRAGEPLFDNALVEPGPPALLTDKGSLLIYNGASNRKDGKAGIEFYAGGQALFDRNNPEKLLARLEKPFIQPETAYELTGQVNKVTFVEGLCFFKGKWFLYYGTADSKIAVAVCEKPPF
ncbi:MAG: glycosidase [Verrucomicrobia bacterium]|nr:glycosidase [Cytophagales bacterium]